MILELFNYIKLKRTFSEIETPSWMGMYLRITYLKKIKTQTLYKINEVLHSLTYILANSSSNSLDLNAFM